MTSKELCQATCWKAGAWRPVRCSKAATREGYCGTHHPDAVAKRDAERTARQDAEMESYRRDRAREQARRDLMTAALQAPALSLSVAMLAAVDLYTANQEPTK